MRFLHIALSTVLFMGGILPLTASQEQLDYEIKRIVEPHTMDDNLQDFIDAVTLHELRKVTDYSFRSPPGPQPEKEGNCLAASAQKFYSSAMKAKLSKSPSLANIADRHAVVSALLDKIFSTTYFATPEEMLPPISPLETFDWTGCSQAQIDQFIQRDRYLHLMFHNLSQYDCDENKFKEYVANEFGRINPLILVIPRSKLPENLGKIHERHQGKERLVREKQVASGLDLFTFPENAHERSAWYETHDLSIFTQALMGNIFQTAKRIIGDTKENDNIIIFGNTPYYLGRAMEHLLNDSGAKRNLINFPFSGSPNRVRPGNFPNIMDMVLPHNLEHLTKRIGKEGLLDPAIYQDRKTYIIDVIGSGAGISYFLDVIVHNLVTVQGNMPKVLEGVQILSMNEFEKRDDGMGNKDFDLRHKAILKDLAFDVKDGEITTLLLPNNRNPRHIIPCQVYYLEGHGYLDNGVDNYPDTLRGFPKYNAAFWDEAFDEILLNREPTYGHRIILEHFDTNMQKFIRQEKQ